MTAGKSNQRQDRPDARSARRNDVRVLSTEQAKAILFPQHAGSPEEKANLPPARTWEPWTAPSPRLPVDDEITALIEADGIIKPSGYGRGFGDCPYYATRLLMALGAGRASKQAAEVRRRQKDLGPKADGLAAQLSRLADLTGRLLAQEGDMHAILRTGTSVMGEWHDVETLEADAKALIPLFQVLRPMRKQIADAAKRMESRSTCITPQNAPGDAWKISWVFALEKICFSLTGGSICDNNGLSYKFIVAAYLSIGGELTSSNDWSSAVKTVRRRIKKLPAWEREQLLSGYSVPKHIEVAAINKGMKSAAEEIVARKIVMDALDKPEEFGWIATVYYNSANAKSQILMDALGWNDARRAKYPDPQSRE